MKTLQSSSRSDLQPGQPVDDRLQAVVIDVPPHPADLAHPEDDPRPGDLFENVEHRLPQPQRLHEQALEAEGIGSDPQPEDVAVDPG